MISIRYATKDDIEAIRTIAINTWPSAYGNILPPDQIEYMLSTIYSPEILAEQFDAPHQYFIMAIGNAAENAGFAAFGQEKDLPSTYHLHKIYVSPEWQHQNTGKLLLEKVLADCENLGASRITLNVNRLNPARYFYEKLGFNIMRKEDIYIGNGYFMNDYIMLKHL